MPYKSVYRDRLSTRILREFLWQDYDTTFFVRISLQQLVIRRHGRITGFNVTQNNKQLQAVTE
jgi:hypothetical protein